MNNQYYIPDLVKYFVIRKCCIELSFIASQTCYLYDSRMLKRASCVLTYNPGTCDNYIYNYIVNDAIQKHTQKVLDKKLTQM